MQTIYWDHCLCRCIINRNTAFYKKKKRKRKWEKLQCDLSFFNIEFSSFYFFTSFRSFYYFISFFLFEFSSNMAQFKKSEIFFYFFFLLENQKQGPKYLFELNKIFFFFLNFPCPWFYQFSFFFFTFLLNTTNLILIVFFWFFFSFLNKKFYFWNEFKIELKRKPN